MKVGKLPPSPIGVCPICRAELFGPSISGHIFEHHPQHAIGLVDREPTELERMSRNARTET